MMDLFEDKIFKNDALYMKSLIGSLVRVNTVDKEPVTGIVYVIDPIYKTLVLHTKESSFNKHDTIIILYHAIESLEILSERTDESYIERKAPIHNSDELAVEKRRIKKWLQQMYISVDEVSEYLKIDDHLLIMPPYGIDNCICNNTIVLEKIRNIISLMPIDFK